jgi:hypothetical protein
VTDQAGGETRHDARPARRSDEPREGSALGGRKGEDGLIGATGRDVGGQAGEGWLGAENEEPERAA